MDSIVILDDDEEEERPQPSSSTTSSKLSANQRTPPKIQQPAPTHITQSPFAMVKKESHVLQAENQKLFTEVRGYINGWIVGMIGTVTLQIHELRCNIGKQHC